MRFYKCIMENKEQGEKLHTRKTLAFNRFRVLKASQRKLQLGWLLLLPSSLFLSFGPNYESRVASPDEPMSHSETPPNEAASQLSIHRKRGAVDITPAIDMAAKNLKLNSYKQIY